jgi:hypothetical protein
MKFLKTKNMYKASNFEFYCQGLKAYSYGWWQFSGVFNGYKVFNDTTYSVSTRRHQSKAWGLMNYKSDIVLNYTQKSLSAGLESVLADEIYGMGYEIKSLIQKVMTKGTKKTANEKRLEQVGYYLNRINEVMKFAKDTQGIELKSDWIGYTSVKHNTELNKALYPKHVIVNDSYIFVTE